MGIGNVIQQAIRRLKEDIAPIDTGRCPSTVYHYTNQDGLLAILRDRRIWATAVEYLNDSKEYVYLSEAASTFVRRHENTFFAGIDDPIASWMLEAFGRRQNSAVFVACFCAHGDRLSQWRGYADAGLGVSLGVATRALRKLAVEQDGRRIEVRFGRCSYSQRELDKRLRRGCAQALVAYRIMKDRHPEPSELSRTVGVIAGLMISHLAPFHKHPEFREEREWRLVVTLPDGPSPLIRVRRGRTTLTPYIEIPLVADGKRLPLNEVIVGPNPTPDLARRGVRQALESHSVANPKDDFVQASKIPFRSW